MITVSKTQKICAVILVASLALYAVIGFYLLPFLVLGKGPGLLSEKTGLQVQIKAFRFNPFRFDLEMQGFTLLATDGNPLFGFEDFAFGFNAWESVKQQTLIIDSISLSKPVVNIVRETDGRFNFSSLLSKPEPAAAEPPKTSVSLPITVRNLALEQGLVNWLDKSSGRNRAESLQPLNLKVSGLSIEHAGIAGFELNFGLATGGQLQWAGEFGLMPVTSKGRINIQQLDLPKIWQEFLQDMLPVQIVDGQFNSQIEYQADISAAGLSLKISNSEMSLAQLQIAEKGRDAGLLGIPDLTVAGIAVDTDKKQIGLGSVSSKDAKISAWLEKDGSVNYQNLFGKTAQEDSAPVTPAAKNKQQDWQINLKQLNIGNYQLLFTDNTQTPPQSSQFTGISLKLQHFAYPGSDKFPLQFSAIYNDAGKLEASGEVGLMPLSAAMAVNIHGIALKNFQSYMNPYLRLEVVDGAINTQGKLNLSVADELQLVFQGDVNVDNLTTRDKVNHRDFLKWNDFQLLQINADLANQTFIFNTIVLDKPYVRITIQKDRSTSFDELMVTQPTTGKPTQAQVGDGTSKVAKPDPIISIGKILLKNGSSDFADYSLILPFVAQMGGLDGEISGFASNQDTPLKLQLKGKVYDLAPVNIKGSYQIKTGDSDIALKFSHMPLPLITPYMADFAGYKIEKGQMDLDLQYTIKQRQLEAKNKIFIDQLALGEQVENPHASSLPLHLAIALLKDADGKINLDFPVTGSLDDPQFSIGSLLVDVLGNLVSKLVTSPFRAFDGLLSEDKDFSTINFEPGSTELDSTESAKLDQLSKALQEKPNLVLEIKGMAFQVQDWPELRFQVLVEILKKMKSGELRDKGQNIRSEYIELNDDEYKRLLEKFFKEVFPQELQHSLLGKPQIKTQPDMEFYEAARQKLEGIFQPEPQRLNEIAIARASAISRYLVEKAGLDISRIYILAPELDPADTVGIVSQLSLNAER